jgi:transglutaminase-like putative cysteine protease
MSRTGFTVAVAAVLAVLSVAMLFTRRAMLGAEIDGPRGNSTWQVSLEVEGTLLEDRTAFITLPPPDFRRQHIYDEAFESDALARRMVHGRTTGRREMVWQRKNTRGEEPFRVRYAFHVAMGLSPATPGMIQNSKRLDAEPQGEARKTYLRPAHGIKMEHKEIQRLAKRLVRPEDVTAADRARALFDYVRKLDARNAPSAQTALECLRQHGGGSGGKGRLLVALCRNREIPARLVTGLVLDRDGAAELHYWAEAWANDDWLPMCPARGHFGKQGFPKNYLVLNVGDEDIVRAGGSPLQSRFTAEKLVETPGEAEALAAGWDSSFWRKLSLYRLQPREQRLVHFLLLLPLAALIVSFFRTVIGLVTFGTFAPALLGMAFLFAPGLFGMETLDLRVLPWGMGVFFLLVVAGWGLRRLLDPLHLLMVPRVSAVLTLLVLLLVTGIFVSAHFGLLATSYVALFPLVILVHMVERFWTVEAEDGTTASFRTLLTTFFVAVVVSLALCWPAVGTWMFRYPETVGGVLACQLLLGRYTGYRLTELYRFSDLIYEEPPKGETDELAATLADAPGPRDPGAEPEEHAVHPGPEPAPAVPAGGRQTANAGTVPDDRRADA